MKLKILIRFLPPLQDKFRKKRAALPSTDSVIRCTAGPRHREIQEFLAAKICRDLGIPKPE